MFLSEGFYPAHTLTHTCVQRLENCIPFLGDFAEITFGSDEQSLGKLAVEMKNFGQQIQHFLVESDRWFLQRADIVRLSKAEYFQLFERTLKRTYSR